MAFNGKLYGMPAMANHVLIYDPDDNTVTGSKRIPSSIAIGTETNGWEKWNSAFLLNNIIYGIPARGHHFLMYVSIVVVFPFGVYFFPLPSESNRVEY